MVAGQIANRAGLGFAPIGMMVEGPRKEKKDQGKKAEINRFLKQISYPRYKVGTLGFQPGRSAPGKPDSSFHFRFVSQKRAREKWAWPGRGSMKERKKSPGWELTLVLHFSKM
jgi:hypothetical protein